MQHDAQVTMGPALDVPPEMVRMAMWVSTFWNTIDRSGGPDDCHPWRGYTEDGYGRTFFAGRMVGAHELAVLFTTGEVRPRGWDTCHSCNYPICCNPRHLRYDTRQGNVDDAIAAGRQARGERQGRSKLTEERVVEIRHRAQNGATGKALAAEYGVSQGLVTAILRGELWAHAPGPLRTEHGNRQHGHYAKGSRS